LTNLSIQKNITRAYFVFLKHPDDENVCQHSWMAILAISAINTRSGKLDSQTDIVGVKLAKVINITDF
jgi:hypothetical protein